MTVRAAVLNYEIQNIYINIYIKKLYKINTLKILLKYIHKNLYKEIYIKYRHKIIYKYI